MFANSLSIAIVSAAMALPAQAGVDFNNWNYALDSTNDGSGGRTYEYLGLAFSQQADKLVFALSTNMPLSGNTAGNSSALNGSIAHGDLFLNFSDHNLDTAAEFTDANVFAVRFSSASDSLGNKPGSVNTTLGLYGDITTAALAGSNRGYTSLQQYLNHGFGRNADAMGDLESSTLNAVPYLGNGAMQTVIKTGTWLGGVTLMTHTELADAGLDFGHFGSSYMGDYVFGFSVDAAALPVGSFTSHVFMECINDGIALSSQTASVSIPEPASLALLTASALLMVRVRRRCA